MFVDPNAQSGKYETDKTNPAGGRFYTIKVEAGADGITITDNKKNTQSINKDKMYNVMVREYWISSDKIANAQLTTSSEAVLHAVDHPLRYSDNQFIYQKVEINDGEEGEEEE